MSLYVAQIRKHIQVSRERTLSDPHWFSFFANTDEGEVARINKGYWSAFKKPIRNRLFIEVLDHDVVSFCVYFFCS